MSRHDEDVSPEQLAKVIAYLENHGGILWEPGKRVGWAICPCCGEREFEIRVPDEWVVEEA
jgi:hypothetical protein